MGAYDNIDQAFAGLKLGLDSQVESWKAAEDIDFGVPVFGYEGDDLSAYNAKQDVQTLLLDADLVTANVYTVTVNGTDVAVPFNTNHDDTMDDVVTAIEAEAALEGIDAFLTDLSGDNRTLKLFWAGENVVATGVVTLGASQAGVTVTSGTDQVFLGVSLYTAKSLKDSVGLYEALEPVNVMTEGQVWVNAFEAVASNVDAFAAFTVSGGNQEKFGTSGYDTGCKFRGETTGAALVLVEVRGQKTDATV